MPKQRYMPARPEQRLLTPQQIAIEFGIPAQTVRDRIIAGELSALRIGKRYWVRREDWERFLASRVEVRA